jgi:hypothetical protein
MERIGSPVVATQLRAIRPCVEFQALFAMRSALRRGRLHTLQHGMARALPRDQYRKRDGGDGENDRSPGGHLGQNVDGSAGAEGCLRTLAAKRACQVRALAGLQQDNSDQNKTNDDMNHGKKIDHLSHFRVEVEMRNGDKSSVIGAEGGT